MTRVKIAATADVHSPRFLDTFESALMDCEEPNLFLFAGDMINRGKSDEYSKILDIMDTQIGSHFPIVACFGNEEPLECRVDINRITSGRIAFLDGNFQVFTLADLNFAVVGISGINMEQLELGSRTIDEIKFLFKNRAIQLSSLLQVASQVSEHLILLMHYSPLNEDNPSEFSWWVSKATEDVQPDLIIHGHVHDSNRIESKIGATTVRNVALPTTGMITQMYL